MIMRAASGTVNCRKGFLQVLRFPRSLAEAQDPQPRKTIRMEFQKSIVDLHHEGNTFCIAVEGGTTTMVFLLVARIGAKRVN